MNDTYKPSFRVLLAFCMASITAAFVAILWLVSGLPDLGASAVGSFFGMLTLIGLTPVGRQMTEAHHVSRSIRGAIGSSGRREIFRSVSKGRAVNDPALALSAIQWAQHVERTMKRPMSRWWYGLLGVLAISSIVRGRYVGAGLELCLALSWPLLQPGRRRRLRHIEQSLQANRAMLGDVE